MESKDMHMSLKGRGYWDQDLQFSDAFMASLIYKRLCVKR